MKQLTLCCECRWCEKAPSAPRLSGLHQRNTLWTHRRTVCHRLRTRKTPQTHSIWYFFVAFFTWLQRVSSECLLWIPWIQLKAVGDKLFRAKFTALSSLKEPLSGTLLSYSAEAELICLPDLEIVSLCSSDGLFSVCWWLLHGEKEEENL